MSSLPLHESPKQSPVEEDISRVETHGYLEAGASPTTRTEKQQQKQREEGPFADGVDEESSDESVGKRDSYPPVNDEAEESRRVEENLRKWEMAEKQRRKAARGSVASTASTSLVDDVTRRASSLWSGKRSRPPVQGVGTHHIVPSSEDGVAMDELDNDTAMAVTPDPENPFRTPMASTVSLNLPGHSAIMTETSDDTSQTLSNSLTTPTDSQPGKIRSHPPPQPLDLPRPRSPPPLTDTPLTNKPPEPVPPPTVSADIREEELPEKRWWTDWLCGCREGHDNQAARTNPFE